MIRTRQLWLMCLGVCLLCGCRMALPRSPSARAVANAPLDPDIIAVNTFWPTYPFMNFDDAGDPNPEGFKMMYYARSGRTEKGVFADGLIRIKMYKITRVPGEQTTGELVKTWEFTPAQALGWRVTKRSVMDWGYQFYLNWGDAEVYGHEVRIVPEFVRRDGSVVIGAARSLKVPPRKMGIRLIETTASTRP